MTGEFSRGEKDPLSVSGRLADLIDRAEQSGEGGLTGQGLVVTRTSMGRELSHINPQEQTLYYVLLIAGPEPTVYMSASQKTEEGGNYDKVVKEVRIGASGEGVVSDFNGEGAGRIETGYQEVAREANQVLDFFETAISKAEQGGKQRGGRLAGLLEKWRRLKDQALDGIEAVMKELDS